MNRRKPYSCGGIGSYEGPCGAGDCPTCRPEWCGTELVDDMAEDTDDARTEESTEEKL